MDRRTPIKIINGRVFAWVWNGQERDRGLPVFYLHRPKPGMWRNGRLLSLPFRSSYITSGRKMENDHV